jgi:YD repeat-containing protein
VNQGAQTRTFQYTSLGRFIHATNPESGTVTYQYYDSGELKERMDARSFVTDFNYDALHRIKDKIYYDPTKTPAAHYTLAPNCRFALYEGENKVAEGVVIEK